MPEIDPKIIKQLVLNGDDFGFEMRIGAILRLAIAAEVTHGGTYTPIGINQSPRQFDYRFSISRGSSIVQCAVECKNLFSRAPLIVCGAKRRDSESYFDVTASDFRLFVQSGNADQDFVSTTVRAFPSPLYPVGGFCGKSIVRPKPPAKPPVNGNDPLGGYSLTNDGDIYDRWEQSLAHAKVLNQTATRLARIGGPAKFVATLPVVVVPNGTLWTMSYDEAGQIIDDPTQVETCELYSGLNTYLGGKADQYLRFSHIHFFTENGLRKFATELNDTNSDVWNTVFSPTEIENYENSRTRPLRIP